MQEHLKIKASGEISIYKIVNGKRELLCTRSNTILAEATDIIVMRLTAIPSAASVIDKIKVYDTAGVGLLATGTIVSSIASYGILPSNVVYEALFDGPSFDGDFDKVELFASGQGSTFSRVTGLTETKNVGEAIIINWKITIGL